MRLKTHHVEGSFIEANIGSTTCVSSLKQSLSGPQKFPEILLSLMLTLRATGGWFSKRGTRSEMQEKCIATSSNVWQTGVRSVFDEHCPSFDFEFASSSSRLVSQAARNNGRRGVRCGKTRISYSLITIQIERHCESVPTPSSTSRGRHLIATRVAESSAPKRRTPSRPPNTRTLLNFKFDAEPVSL